MNNTPDTQSNELTREEWIQRAAKKLEPYEGINSRDYAEALFVSYCEDDGTWTDDPEGAVDEDMSYWDADE